MGSPDRKISVNPTAKEVFIATTLAIVLVSGACGLTVPMISYLSRGECSSSLRLNPTRIPDSMGADCGVPGVLEIGVSYGPIPIPRVYQTSGYITIDGIGSVALGIRRQTDPAASSVSPIIFEAIPDPNASPDNQENILIEHLR